MSFSLDRERDNLETLIFIFLNNSNIKINNLLIHKNFIVDEITKYYELNDNKIISYNINNIIIKYPKIWKKLTLIMGMYLMCSDLDLFFNKLNYINILCETDNKIYLPFDYVRINQIFYTVIINWKVPLVWKYSLDYEYLILKFAFGYLPVFNDIDIEYVPKVEKYTNIKQSEFGYWIAMTN